MNNNPLIVLVGPTASGKTSLSIRLAKYFSGEIVSADSRQVYRSLDIGSGKVTADEMQGVAHHLLDVAQPGERFTVAHFKQLVDRALADIYSRDLQPFIVGGSMLYVDAVVEQYHIPDVGRDENYRSYLESCDTDQRLRLLNEVDPDMYASIDRNNSRRVIRALEVYHLSGIPLSRQRTKAGANPDLVLKLCIELPRSALYESIDRRVDTRMSGMIDEVRGLLASGVSASWLVNLGLEYRFLTRFITETSQSIKDLGDMTQKLKFAIHDFARRQLIWYRRDSSLCRIHDYDDAARRIELFLLAQQAFK